MVMGRSPSVTPKPKCTNMPKHCLKISKKILSISVITTTVAREPVVLPARLPNLLLNGQVGIAVGMATSIPPHNLTEVIGATKHLMDNPDAETADLLKFVKGPDFPTGGVIYGGTTLKTAYETGRGSVVVRGVAEIVEPPSGGVQIIISEIPYISIKRRS